MKNIAMIDDTVGKIEEAMIFYNPLTSMTIEEPIDALPDTKFYVPYGYTKEDLEKLITALPERMNYLGLQLAMRFLELITSYPPFMIIFNSHETSVREQLRQWKIDSRRARKSLPIPYEDVSAIYTRFKTNPQFREFVYLWLSFNNAKHHQLKGSYQDVESLKKKYGDRLEIFPVNDIIGTFSRDRIIADHNGGRILIQGKPDTFGSLTYNRRADVGDMRVAEHAFWKGKYGLVPVSDVNLALYEGGDLRAARETLFVGQDTWLANLRAGYTPFQIEEELSRISGRKRIVVVGKDITPLFLTHLDMYFTPFDDKAVAIGDITPLVKHLESQRKLTPLHIRSYKEKQPYLDGVSRRLEEMGFEVARIPLYLEFDSHGYDERGVAMSLRSFANDVRNGDEAIVATFGVPELDEMGYRVFERYGLRVRGVNTAGSLDTFLRHDQLYAVFDSAGVRCMVNVLAKR